MATLYSNGFDTLDDLTQHISAAGSPNQDIAIAASTLVITQWDNKTAHVHPTGLQLPTIFRVSCKIKSDVLDGGTGWSPGIGVLWDADNWVLIKNRVDSANLRIDRKIGGSFSLITPDGTEAGSAAVNRFYRIAVDDTNITYYVSDDGVEYTEKHQEANFKSEVQPVLTTGLMIGFGYGLAAQNAEWNAEFCSIETDLTGTFDTLVVDDGVDEVASSGGIGPGSPHSRRRRR